MTRQIIVADDHPLFREALKAAVGRLDPSMRFVEAESVYREDLARIPDNGWSLFGLAHSLRLQGKDQDADAVQSRFERVWAESDVQIESSCLCARAGGRFPNTRFGDRVVNG